MEQQQQLQHHDEGHIFDGLSVRLHRRLSAAETEEMRHTLRDNGALITAAEDPHVFCVVPSFEGDVKAAIQDARKRKERCLIVGINVIRECVRQHRKIPVERLPLLSLALEGVVAYPDLMPTDHRIDTIRKLIYLGAVVLDAPGSRMTHLILGKESLRTLTDAPPRFSATCVTRAWLAECWRSQGRAPESNYQYLPLDGKIVSITGIQPSTERTKYATRIRELGAKFSADFSQDVSHLVVDEEHVDTSAGAKFAWAVQWQKPVVSKEWIDKMRDIGYLLPESLFGVQKQPEPAAAAEERPIVQSSATSVSGAGHVNPEENIEFGAENRFFEGRIIDLMGFPRDLQEKYKQAIVEAGGSVDSPAPHKVTHFVVFNPANSAKTIATIAKHGAIIVDEKWIKDCIALRECISGEELRKYRIQPSPTAAPVITSPPPLPQSMIPKLSVPTASAVSPAKRDRPSNHNQHPTSKTGQAIAVPCEYDRDPSMDPPAPKRAKVAAAGVAYGVIEVPSQDVDPQAPLGTTFSGKVVFFPPIGDWKDVDYERAKTWVQDEGGVVALQEPSVCDYVVLPHGFRLTNFVSSGVLVSPNWIILCASDRRLVDTQFVAGFRPLRLRPDELRTTLDGCCITISQYSGWQREALKMMVQLLGAQFEPALKIRKTTHVILKEPKGDKFKVAVQRGKFCIQREWLDDSAEFGYKADEAKHAFQAEMPAIDREALAQEALQGIDLNDLCGFSAGRPADDAMQVDTLDATVDADVPPTAFNQFGSKTNLVNPNEPVLAGVRLYVSGRIKDPEAARTTAKDLGAEIAWDVDASVTHVVFEGKPEFSRELKIARDRRLHIVSPYWLSECRKHMRRLAEALFPCGVDPHNSLLMDSIPTATTVKSAKPAQAPATSAVGGFISPIAPVRKSAASASSSASTAPAKFLDDDEETLSYEPPVDVSFSRLQTRTNVSIDANNATMERVDAPPAAPATPNHPATAAFIVDHQPPSSPIQISSSINVQPVSTPQVVERPRSPPKPSSSPKPIMQAPPKPIIIQHELDVQEERKRKQKEERSALSSLLKLIPTVASSAAPEHASDMSTHLKANRPVYELVTESASQAAPGASARPAHQVQPPASLQQTAAQPMFARVPENNYVAYSEKDIPSSQDVHVLSSQQVEISASAPSGMSARVDESQEAVIGYRRAEEDSGRRSTNVSRFGDRDVGGLVRKLLEAPPPRPVESENRHMAPPPTSFENHRDRHDGASMSSGSGFGADPSEPSRSNGPRIPDTPAVAHSGKKATAKSGASRPSAAQPKAPPAPKYVIGLSGFGADPNDRTFKEREDVIRIVERLGGTISNGLGPDITHLVARDTPRSPKVITSIAYGRWIVTINWIIDCGTAGRFLPEEPYEWTALLASPQTQEAAAACKMNRLRREKKRLRWNESLFSGRTIACYLVDKAEVNLNMLKNCGFNVLSDLKPNQRVIPTSFDPDVLLGMNCELFFADRNSVSDPMMRLLIAPSNLARLPVVSTNYISDFLLKPDEPDPRKFLPTPAARQ